MIAQATVVVLLDFGSCLVADGSLLRRRQVERVHGASLWGVAGGRNNELKPGVGLVGDARVELAHEGPGDAVAVVHFHHGGGDQFHSVVLSEGLKLYQEMAVISY